MKLTATIITHNEAANLQAALDSVAFADEIVVVDGHSTDDTAAIARRTTDKVFVRRLPEFNAAIEKNYAAEQASHDWILSIDADERISAPLADEIRALLAAGPPQHGYRVPRVTFHLGRWLRSTDWYPDRQLRLYHRRHARWGVRHVHESVEVDGAIGQLRGELLHYSYRDISHHLQTIDRHTTLAARQMFEAGRRAGWVDLALHPPAAFFRNYVLHGGFRDGIPGLVVSMMNAHYVGLKFAKLWELCAASISIPPAPGAGDNSKRS